jgi:hypothetical protein
MARHEARTAIIAHVEALYELEQLTWDRMVDDPQEARLRWWQRVRLPRRKRSQDQAVR